jgi:ABC-2 type transport system permease protein
MPVWRPAPIAGGLIGDGGRDLPAAALVIAVAVSRSWAWAALGLVLRSPNAILSVGLVALFPITFASDVPSTRPPCPPGCAPSPVSTR